MMRLLLWLVIAPGIPFLLVSAAIIAYANWPGDTGLQEPEHWEPDLRKITLVTHGKGDSAEGWVASMVEQLRQQTSPREAVLGIDWSRGATNLFRCSRNADVAGRRLADLLLAHNPQLSEVEFIAHSAGAFMAYGLCQQIKAVRPEVQLRLTYLDPSGVYRGLWWNYGYRHFGSCADEALTIYNVGDGVPGSEAPPDHGEALDISALRPVDDPSGHLWPVRYYSDRLAAQPAR